MNSDQQFFIKNNIENIIKNVNAVNIDNRDIKIMLATKTRTAEEINFALSCGINYIGENRVQELVEKYDDINKNNCHIHFIGHLQKNKVKYIIDKVEMIHSVDSFELASEINRCAKNKNLIMNVLCEINIGKEESKSGVYIEQAEEFIKKIAELPNIRVSGLMTIPPKMTSIDNQKKFFTKIYDFYIDISTKKLDNVYCEVLSMGMSDDYVPAIECGSNLVRIGTAAFGKRKY